MGNQNAFGFAVFLAAACSGVLMISGNTGSLPVLGSIPLSWAVLLMAVLGYPAITVLVRRGVAPVDPPTISFDGIARLTLIGAVLAIPPILIDLFLPFPEGMNVPPPDGLFFYPAIGLVAEVQFHLIPLALLALILPRTVNKYWLIIPVVLLEPLFQVFFLQGASLQSVLVLLNVGLVSAVQLWLFLRHGFAAMYGLRIAFYLVWHIIWGTARIHLLF